MSNLSDIVQVTISRETTAVSRAGFGTIGIIAQFETSKTVTTFDRYREYASLSEMSTDGWGVTDYVYQAAQLVFAQNPKVPKVMVGRKASGDASWDAALTAINTASQDWYGFGIIATHQAKLTFKTSFSASNVITVTVNGTAVSAITYGTSHADTMTALIAEIEADVAGADVTLDSRDAAGRTILISVKGLAPTSVSAVVTGGSAVTSTVTWSTSKLVFSANFVASNSIIVSINGVAGTAVVFDTNQATTMTALKTQLETDFSTAIVTVDASDGNSRTLLVDVDKMTASVSAAVTLGSTQPTATPSSNLGDTYKAVALWTETQKKIFFFSSSLADIITTSTADLASEVEALSYDRTIQLYHTDTIGDEDPSMIEFAWPGEAFPYDPGSQTWAYKSLSGVVAYSLTSAQRTAVLGKNCNIYTETAGVDVTERGNVSSGEWIDIIRGIDWLESRLMEDVYTNLVNTRKIPYTDAGITLIEGTVKGVLDEGVRQGLLAEGTVETTVPKVADISSADKAARTLDAVEFEAQLQGAIHIVKINGVVTI